MAMKYKKIQKEGCMEMNKEKFIKTLQEKLNIDENTAIIINNTIKKIWSVILFGKSIFNTC